MMEELETAILVKDTQPEEEYTLYKKRWIVLALFVLILSISQMQMQQFVSITETIVIFYDVSITEVNWTTLVYFLAMVITVFPSIFIVEKLGLRKTVLIGSIGTVIGSWIKVGGVAPNRFWVIILGQAVNGIFSSVLLIVPPKVASKWFGANEVSSANGIGVLTSPAAYAIGFLIPTSTVDSKIFKEIERGLFLINIVYAAVPTLLIPLLYYYFDDSPPTPPTKSQFLIQNDINLSGSYVKSIKKFMTNRSFMCLTFVYNINAAFFYALTTLLNPIMIKFYPHSTTEIGYIGCIINFVGMFGVILSGIVLDKFRRYKLTGWVFGILNLTTTATFIFLLSKGLLLVYFLAGLYGFFTYTFVLAVIEIAIEVTYPEPEIAVFGFFAIGAQTCAICFTYLCTYLINNCSDLTVNLVFIGVIIVGDAALIFVKYDLKRQAVLQ